MRSKSKRDGIAAICVVFSIAVLAGCQTTRRATAVKNADNQTMDVHVSADPRSLMGSDSTAKTFSDISKQKPGSSVASLQVHAELALIGQMPRAAADHARAILRQDPKNLRAMKTLIKVALVENKPHEAKELCENALAQASQDAEIFSLQGLAQYQLNFPLYAKALWQKAVALDPLYIPALMNLGALYFQFGHTAKAGSYFDKVVAIAPHHLDAQVGRALVISGTGQPERAVANLEEILEKNGDSLLVLENLAVLSRDGLKDYKKSMKFVERTLALKQTDRRSLEWAVGMKQELNKLLATQSKQLSDESLREMASTNTPTSGLQAEQQQVVDSQSSLPNDLLKMEENLK